MLTLSANFSFIFIFILAAITLVQSDSSSLLRCLYRECLLVVSAPVYSCCLGVLPRVGSANMIVAPNLGNLPEWELYYQGYAHFPQHGASPIT